MRCKGMKWSKYQRNRKDKIVGWRTVKLSLCKARRDIGGRLVAQLALNPGNRRKKNVSFRPRPPYVRGKEPWHPLTKRLSEHHCQTGCSLQGTEKSFFGRLANNLSYGTDYTSPTPYIKNIFIIYSQLFHLSVWCYISHRFLTFYFPGFLIRFEDNAGTTSFSL